MPFSLPPEPNGFAHLLGLLRPRAKMAAVIVKAHPWGFKADADETATMYIFHRGGAVLSVNGSTISVGSGDIVIVHGVSHALASADNVPSDGNLFELIEGELHDDSATATHEFATVVYSLSVTAECKVRNALPKVMLVPSTDGQTPLWHRTVSELSRMVDVRRPDGSSAIANQLSELLFTLAVQDYSDRVKRTFGKDAVIGGDPKLVSLVVDIQAQPGANWSIDKMAGRLFMSRSTFCDMFTKTMGEAPVQYVTRIRMGVTADTLLATNLSADQIAEMVGYGSATALVRAFRRHFGVSPAEYRRSRGQANHSDANA